MSHWKKYKPSKLSPRGIPEGNISSLATQPSHISSFVHVSALFLAITLKVDLLDPGFVIIWKKNSNILALDKNIYNTRVKVGFTRGKVELVVYFDKLFLHLG